MFSITALPVARRLQSHKMTYWVVLTVVVTVMFQVDDTLNLQLSQSSFNKRHSHAYITD